MQEIVQFSEQNVLDLKEILAKVHGDRFLEIGCWTGHSTSYIAEELRNRHGFEMVVIDTFRGSVGTEIGEPENHVGIREKFSNNMTKLGLRHYIHIYQGRSCDMVHNFPNSFFNFIFIDGSHMYEDIKLDLDLYLPKMRYNGIIAGHDFESFTYKSSSLHLESDEGKHHGVIKAVTEKFGNKVRRLGNIWYVDLGVKHDFWTLSRIRVERYIQPKHSYIRSMYNPKWMERSINR